MYLTEAEKSAIYVRGFFAGTLAQWARVLGVGTTYPRRGATLVP